MGRVENYRETLRSLDDWDGFLLENSNLPGPRGNLELAQAVTEEGNALLFERLRAYEVDRAPVNTPGEFLAFYGVLGLGRLLAEGNLAVRAALRGHAADPRWRIREAIAMALQRWGAQDFAALLDEMTRWSTGSLLERRAAVAALCEPALLRDPTQVNLVLRLLDQITASLLEIEDRRSEPFQALKKGLGYCWSVAVAALPEEGREMMERWLDCGDRDVRWVMRENLRKKRLNQINPTWIAAALARVDG
ncbi:MAG: hypothetical protein GX601_11830 [Anaerolineales bacterium]|nr:hypothetical protein [Anaerolineales bacterium]